MAAATAPYCPPGEEARTGAGYLPLPGGQGAMIDEATLEMNVLSFLEKSFSYERTVELDGTPYAVFQRTEVESESKFRPKLVRLKLVVPRESVLGDLASDMLVLAPNGTSAGPRRTGPAVEVAADSTEFREQGIEFHRTVRGDGTVVYLPKSEAERLLPLLD